MIKDPVKLSTAYLSLFCTDLLQLQSNESVTVDTGTTMEVDNNSEEAEVTKGMKLTRTLYFKLTSTGYPKSPCGLFSTYLTQTHCRSSIQATPDLSLAYLAALRISQGTMSCGGH